MDHKLLSVLFILLALTASASEVHLAGIFGDGMVLQRNHSIPVWGWGRAGATFDVSLAGNTVKTTVDTSGRWQVVLPALKAGGPYILKAGDTELKDILIGDVFLCTGQSNMELPVSRCMDKVAGKVKGYSNDQIRYVKLPHQFNYITPNEDVQTLGWKHATPEEIQKMGAVSFFAGREIQETENVPVGIINSSVGGTGIECWMSRDTLMHHHTFVKQLTTDRKFTQTDWVDSVRRAEGERSAQWEKKLLTTDSVTSACTNNNYNYFSWKDTPLFSRWASGENGNVYGSYWFRNTFEIEKPADAVIRLGAMKDADSVWVNGTFVGNTTYEYPPRIYKVPVSVLRQGQNDVVIKLMAQGGYPHFVEGKLYQIECGDKVIPLTDGWQMKRGAVMPAKPGSTYFVNTPTGLYNAMIAPLRNLPVCGAVWYQGENDTNMSRLQYASLLGSLVRCWRNQWDENFPVVIVQLAGYMQHHEQPLQQSGWCDIRLSELDATEQIPDVVIATAVDLGESNDIHPQKKDEMGRRVALQWRRMIYGRNITAEGPRPVKARLKNGQIILTFSKKTGALRPEASYYFAIAGEDGKFVGTVAWMLKKRTIIVHVPKGMTPVTLRYAYDDYPELTIYNFEGLPAPEFEIKTMN